MAPIRCHLVAEADNPGDLTIQGRFLVVQTVSVAAPPTEILGEPHIIVGQQSCLALPGGSTPSAVPPVAHTRYETRMILPRVPLTAQD